MKSKFFRYIVCLFLCLAMAFQLYACTDKPQQTEETSSDGTGGTMSPEDTSPWSFFGSASVDREGVISSQRGEQSGAVYTESIPKSYIAEFDIKINRTGEASVFFAGSDENNGCALFFNVGAKLVILCELKDGERTQLDYYYGNIKTEKWYPVRIMLKGTKLTVYINDNELDANPFPKFEMASMSFRDARFSLNCGNATADYRAFTLKENKNETLSASDGYLNPVTSGADPEILFHEGVYYLYNRTFSGSNVVKVSTSEDLVNWKDAGIAVQHSEAYGIPYTSWMSPNVIYYESAFYMFMAAKNSAGKEQIYVLQGSSPLGPFKFKDNIPRTLHSDGNAEIGGDPYIDDDGQIYITFVRFNNGNHTCIQRFTFKDGIFTPVEGTLTVVASPTENYEIDSYGRIAEGGVILKHKGYYYYVYASGHYKGHYGASYTISDNILGPYTKYQYNEILHYNAAIDGVGDIMFTTSPDGTEIFAVYHCHTVIGNEGSSRSTCIDRVKFVPDPDGGPDILDIFGPTTTRQPMPSGS